MILPPTRSTRTYTLFPYPTLFRSVADDSGGQRRALAAVLAIDVLHDFLASLVLEVDVDVRRLLALGGDEALEQQVRARRVDLCDAEAEAEDRKSTRLNSSQ